ncbi:twin-arginine translocase TatA/TatE family subunit [Brevibacillus sp. 7WMA2]|uniref:twin-arginine translocase TatA/TatE family subunit n=1 Tax=Brevibacillus TaxID=55080 RepID=UPI0004CE740E|nr:MULTISPECIES: twin-arginine translocase TatA/TatE family subunit [Brevibacillus]WPS88245.1 twin-arginine translocase TatA/TatE family subunit [Brevibacillus halotolerans]AUM63469.1 twin-arginine translocase TatA/TatE family subunit [Brevibacillus laterosporus]MCR8997758.1 twin-arginine translocase TatA/TatE family subunit [Brevibacillus laterosporus]MDF9413600.1 twin-arginine translocase TatA/TatE family subunit [Brevibacillus laterosporus]PCN42476.1 twin-arginine translocase TatA/TatE fami
MLTMGSGIGASGFIILIILAIIFFGPKKLPELGRAMGSTLREFKKATSGLANDDFDENKKEKPAEQQLVAATAKPADTVETSEKIDREKLEREIRERLERERLEKEIRAKIEQERKEASSSSEPKA